VDARPRRDGEQGHSVIEYILVLAFVGVVVVALLGSGVRGRATVAMATAVCHLFGGDCAAPPAGPPPPPPVDEEAVAGALEDIEEALGDDVGGVTTGDLNTITDVLGGLDPAERNAVLERMTDEQIERWLREVSNSGLLPPWRGLGEDERRELFNRLFPGLSAENVDRLLRATDELRPPYDDIPDFEDDDVAYGTIPGASLYRDGVSVDDIDQGQLGDCHLLSSLAAIAAQDPSAIERMIVDHGNGTYTVTFYVDGEPVQVTVSDEFPLRHGQSPFSDPGDPPEIWPLIIEKAWAQYKGSYGEIHGAVTAETLASMTGGEVTSTDAEDQSLGDLATRFGAGHPVAVSSFQDDDVDDIPEYQEAFTDANGMEVPPLVSGHAYYVTDVDEAAGTITIRNPHGPTLPPITLAYDDFQRLFRGVAISGPDE
jgi:Flp pilus assembly pilin Flp